MNSFYNVGVIGMGIGEQHAKAYQSHPKCRLVSLCDFEANRNKQLVSNYPNQNIYDDANDLIDDANIDILSVASYDNFHAKQIIGAIKSKKHVMAEKPLCLSRLEMEKIKYTLDQNPGVFLSSNLVLRTYLRFIRIKKDLSSNVLGDVYYIEADYYWGRKHKLFEWRSDMEFYSIILGAAIHMIDLVMWMVEARPVSVIAVGNDIATKGSKLKFNSFAALFLKFENGLIAKITGNGGCVHPHFHRLNIFGTNKTMIHNLENAYYINSSSNVIELDQIIEPYPEKESRNKIIHSFVNYIDDTNRSPLVTQKDVFDVLSVCFAAEDSMSTGEVINIQYLD